MFAEVVWRIPAPAAEQSVSRIRTLLFTLRHNVRFLLYQSSKELPAELLIFNSPVIPINRKVWCMRAKIAERRYMEDTPIRTSFCPISHKLECRGLK